jgi:PAS domain S-box-containing protein
MSKEFVLFDKDELSFSNKFLRLMDLLVTNKSSSRLECLILFGVFYLQILSGFFSSQIGVLDKVNSNSDILLDYVQKIVRVKDLFIDNHTGFQIALILMLVALASFSLYVVYIISSITKNTFYTYKEVLINFFLKSFLFVGFIPILDLSLANLCFEDYNPNFQDIKCDISTNVLPFVLAIFLIFYSIFLSFFINIFYVDSHFLSNSFYARMSYNYEIYLTLNNIIYCVLLSQAKYIGQEVFLIYNFIISLVMLKVYFNKYLFYDPITNLVVGVFHILYAWTGIFFLLFYYLDFHEKGIIYLIGCVIIIVLYYNLKIKLENKILLKTPFHKIDNKYHLLYYLKTLLDKINNFEANAEDKAQLIGIIQLHMIECPNPDCTVKHRDKKIYLPVTNEWSYRDKNEVNDKVFLVSLLLVIINYFINQSFYSADMLINLSLYYLTVIGNYCQAMVIYKKVKEMKLTLQEKFSFTRLKFLISKTLVEKLKPPNEGCPLLEDLNCTLYFKYDDLSHKFFDEINNDINLSLEFWKCFKVHNETNRPLDFNKIFNLTDKIRITKSKIDRIWQELFSTYSGVNDLFDLYENYVEQINDDDLLKRELETIKNRNQNSTEHIQLNFYNILFKEETGILIANGDKTKEGIIEKTNDEIEKIFLYKADELKGLNVNILMPRMFERLHKGFMERYSEIGEKRIMDRQFKTFAKDKENSLIPITLCVKLFPLLSDHIYYCALVTKENLDDVVLIDKSYNIQGISKKLLQKFEIDSKTIFYQMDIPFYVVCRDFIKFYTTYIKPKRNSNKVHLLDLEEDKREDSDEEAELFELTENLELEYEIRIPQFLLDYVTTVNRRETKIDVKLMRTNSLETDDFKGDTSEIGDENENLIEETPINNGNNAKLSISKQTDEDKDFINRIQPYRTMFDTHKYNDLYDLIDKNYSEHPTKEHKFNFNFSIHRFGEEKRNKAYVIRCMNQKNEDEGDSQHGKKEKDSKSNTVKTKKLNNKLEQMTTLYEIYPEERVVIDTKHKDYLKLVNENKEFAKVQSVYKDEIQNSSKIFGIRQHETAIDEENSSQSSASGFNDNLSKKSRIEEIRSNIMKNISNFYALKWIKIIFIIMFILTAGFCGCYLIIYQMMCNHIQDLSDLNINYFQSTIWLSNIIGSLISMRKIWEYRFNNEDLYFNTYISDQSDYFDTLQSSSVEWYDKILKNFGMIEQKMSLYYSGNDIQPLWNEGSITYPSSVITDNESYPLALSLVLSENNKLIQDPYFSIKALMNNLTDAEDLKRVKYAFYISVENSINNVIPQQLEMLNKITQDFMVFNSNNMIYVLIVIISYGFIMIILSMLYLIFLYLTNKNMQEGFEKASMIKNDKIDETIKKIENFNKNHLSKYRQKEIRSLDDETRVPETNFSVVNNTSNTAASTEKYKSFSGDTKKYKNLKILSYSYFQVIFLIAIISCILVPLYFISFGMVEDTNMIFNIETFILGRLSYASHNTVNIKCSIANCGINKPINNTNTFLTAIQNENIVRQIIDFPELNDFYNNKFLLNACLVLYNSTQPEYTTCMNDVIIKSANNTDSLLKLLDETISIISKDRDMKTGKTITNAMNKTIPFANKYLFETTYFNELETIFYKFITPISDNFSLVVKNSLSSYLRLRQITIIILVCVFAICIMIFAIYVIFIFINKLIHLLSVSRCILRIIPTVVITHTQELEIWIESKY